MVSHYKLVYQILLCAAVMEYAPVGQLTTSPPATVHVIQDTWGCFVSNKSQVVLMIMLLAYTKGIYFNCLYSFIGLIHFTELAIIRRPETFHSVAIALLVTGQDFTVQVWSGFNAHDAGCSIVSGYLSISVFINHCFV